MSEQGTPIPADVLDEIDRALVSAVSTSLALGPLVSEPYSDDPRWGPNSRFLEPMGRRALDAVVSLRRARR